MNSNFVRIPDGVEFFFGRFASGRKRLLALTYKFDKNAFERKFSRLFTRAIQIDVITGEDLALGHTPHGPDYRVWRANWRGTFHPKVLVMMANDHAMVGLGSANLTMGGFGENLESWAFFEGTDHFPVLAGVRNFLELLNSRGIISKRVEMEEIIEALPAKEGDSALISTLNGTLFDQVINRVGKRVKQVDIISPLNCNPSKVISSLHEKCDIKTINLYTDIEKVPRIEGIDDYWILQRPTQRDEEDQLQLISQSHAKLYAFHQFNFVDLFWGSANLSPSGWLLKGRNANVDFLVHSRVTHREWLILLNRLPNKHTWRKVRPQQIPFPKEERESGRLWLLLHGIYENGRLTLEANGGGKVIVFLRSVGEKRGMKICLKFSNNLAEVPEKIARRLGLNSGSPPKELEWSLEGNLWWRKIPVNYLDNILSAEIEKDLADILFYKYAGRQLPSSSGPNPDKKGKKPITKGDPDSYDEEELTRSDYQGELDQFVLKWRIVARSIAGNYKNNSRLWHYSFNDVLNKIKDEAKKLPGKWSDYRIKFVKELLERYGQSNGN